MRQPSLVAFVGTLALMLMLSSIVGAAQVYHPERLPFVLTDAGL